MKKPPKKRLNLNPLPPSRKKRARRGALGLKSLSPLERFFAQVALCKKSLYAFVKRAWKLVVRNHPFVDGWHIKAICDHLQAVTEGKIKSLLINIPPRHTKSLIVSVFWPAWVWASNPTVQWLFGSRTQVISLRDNRKCRDLIQTKWYQQRFNIQVLTNEEVLERYGNEVEFSDDQNLKSFYANTEGGHRIATSASSQGTGLDADVIVIDDLHGINDSEERIASDVEWCEDTAWSRGNTEDAPRVVIGQRVRGNDISAHIISGKAGPGWVKLILPMEYEPKRHCRTPLLVRNEKGEIVQWEDPRRKKGEILAPERRSRGWIDAFKANKPGSHARLNQQNPTPAEGGTWKFDWLENRYRILEFEKVSLWGTSTDTPFKDPKRAKTKEKVDYYAQTMIAEIKRTIETDDPEHPVKTIIDYYFLGCAHDQMGYPKMKQEFRKFVRFWDTILGGAIGRNLVEDKANGSAIIDDLSDEIPCIEPYDPGKISKDLRFELVAPTVKAGRLHFPEEGAVITRNGKVIHQIDASFVPKMIAEFGELPTGEHDDMADTFAQWDLHNRYGDTSPDPAGEVAEPEHDVFEVRPPGGLWA